MHSFCFLIKFLLLSFRRRSGLRDGGGRGKAEWKGEGGRGIDPSFPPLLPSSLPSSLVLPPCPHPPTRPLFYGNALHCKCNANAVQMQCNANAMQCIRMQCNAIAMPFGCNAIQRDWNAMRLQCHAISNATQCNAEEGGGGRRGEEGRGRDEGRGNGREEGAGGGSFPFPFRCPFPMNCRLLFFISFFNPPPPLLPPPFLPHPHSSFLPLYLQILLPRAPEPLTKPPSFFPHCAPSSAFALSYSRITN